MLEKIRKTGHIFYSYSTSEISITEKETLYVCEIISSFLSDLLKPSEIHQA